MKKFMGRTMAKMHENRRNGRKALKGFTLVEIIVVLVILAILAAAMIPALTGYIDKAKERTAISEGRNVLTACQTLISEEYGLHGVKHLNATDGEDTAFLDALKGKALTNKALELADITKGESSFKGEIKNITLKKAKVETLTYETSGSVKVYYDGKEFYAGDEALKTQGLVDDNGNWKTTTSTDTTTP